MFKLKNQNLYSIADFALEFLNDGEEEKIPKIVASFKKCIDIASFVDNNNMIAMKISSLTPISFMKFSNELQHFLKIIENSKDKTYDEVIEELNTYGLSKFVKFDKNSFEDYKIFALNDAEETYY